MNRIVLVRQHWEESSKCFHKWLWREGQQSWLILGIIIMIEPNPLIFITIVLNYVVDFFVSEDWADEENDQVLSVSTSSLDGRSSSHQGRERHHGHQPATNSRSWWRLSTGYMLMTAMVTTCPCHTIAIVAASGCGLKILTGENLMLCKCLLRWL